MSIPFPSSSSPRLPSPPPIPEDQTGPSSPGGPLFEDLNPNTSYLSTTNGAPTDPSASRRIRPGTKSEDMAEGPPLIELADITSAFPLTEHLSALHYSLTTKSEGGTRTTAPLTPHQALTLATPPAGTAREIWLYELARFLTQHTNALLVALFTDTPPCSPQTCAEMRASEWQYLCAVHDPPKSCAAIDYCCHTLDWASSVLCNSKIFPSRLGLGTGLGGGQGQGEKLMGQQMKELTNVFRRVYRIYAHAWFQHREVFWRVELRTGLYGLFKCVCDVYGLIQSENYTIPAEAEQLPSSRGDGERTEGDEHGDFDGREGQGGRNGLNEHGMPAFTPSLMRRPEEVEPKGEKVLAGSDTTKRHRHTHSHSLSGSGVGLSAATIAEEAEEDEDKPVLQRADTAVMAEEKAPDSAKEGESHDDEAKEVTKAETVDEHAEMVEREEQELAKEFARNDTMRPDTDADADAELEHEAKDTKHEDTEEDESEPNITVIEADEPSPELEATAKHDQAYKLDEADEGISKTSTSPDLLRQDDKDNIEVMEPAESAAADADEAGKSVGD